MRGAILCAAAEHHSHERILPSVEWRESAIFAWMSKHGR